MTTDHTPAPRVCAFKNPHAPHTNSPGRVDEWQCPGVPASAASGTSCSACGGRNGEHWHRCPDRNKQATPAPAALPDERLAAIRAAVDELHRQTERADGESERATGWADGVEYALLATRPDALLAEVTRLRGEVEFLRAQLAEATFGTDAIVERMRQQQNRIAELEQQTENRRLMNRRLLEKLREAKDRAAELKQAAAKARHMGLAEATEAVDAMLTAEPDTMRASALYEVLLKLSGMLPCTCARSQGLHAEGCRRYVAGHDLASPVTALARYREDSAGQAGGGS